MYKIMVKMANGKVRDTSKEDLKKIRQGNKELLQAFVDGLNYSREKRKNVANLFVVVNEEEADEPKKEEEEPKKTEKEVSACVKKSDKKTVSKKVEDLPVKFPKPKDKKA